MKNTLLWIALAWFAFVAIAVVFKPTPSLALWDNDVPGVVRLSSQYPSNAATPSPTPITASATGTTTGFTATLPVGTAKQTVFICGAEIDAAATAGTVVPATITGTFGGTLNFLEFVSTTASAGNGRNVYNFSPCIPASAANTAIVINAGAAGTAGIASISAWGYLL
jgi:hypothetical protein